MNFSSCGYVKKDVLYEYPIEDITQTGKTTAAVEKFDELFTGNILAYNHWRDIAVYNTTEDISDTTGGYGLYISREGTRQNVSLSLSRFSSALASESGEVFFVDRDTSGTQYVYKTDSAMEKRTLLAKGEAGKNVVWCVSEGNTFIYTDKYNRIKSVIDGKEESLFELPEGYTPVKMRYIESDGMIMLIASPINSQVFNLYRIDTVNKKISAVDVNVTDMSVVASAKRTAYLKIDSRGQKQLYVYDHNTVIRRSVTGGNIEKFTLSPYGGYIAYSQKPSEGGNGSVWVINIRDYTNVQVAANTSLSSEIYWEKGERGLIYTQVDTGSDISEKETVDKTYKVTFNYVYTEE